MNIRELVLNNSSKIKMLKKQQKFFLQHLPVQLVMDNNKKHDRPLVL